jgi:uncharacterized protein (DUF1810 family)
MNDPYNLKRFVEAQGPAIAGVLEELRAGEKRSHWMWFVFPQAAGLGSSTMARRFAIASRGEARAFMAHPVLGPRLVECARLVVAAEGRTIERIFGYPDNLKFRSSMTLFAQVSDDPVFRAALDKYFGGAPDPATLARI